MPDRFSYLFVFALCFATSVAAEVGRGAEAESKRVLLLYTERAEVPVIRAIDSGLREAFAARGGVEVFAEYFDFAWFPAGPHIGRLIRRHRVREGSQRV